MRCDAWNFQWSQMETARKISFICAIGSQIVANRAPEKCTSKNPYCTFLKSQCNRSLRDPEKCGQLKKEAVRYDTPVDNFTLSTHGAPLPQKASGGYWFWRIIWGMFAHAKNIYLACQTLTYTSLVATMVCQAKYG